MIDYFASHLWQAWGILCLVGLILEVSSGDFFIMCFAIGALVSAVSAGLGLSLVGQIIVFALVSVLCLFLVRPVVLRYLHRPDRDRPSNADALIGREGCVSKTIEANGFGRVAIDGDDWKARAVGDAAIAAGERVRVVEMDSIILTVEQL